MGADNVYRPGERRRRRRHGQACRPVVEDRCRARPGCRWQARTSSPVEYRRVLRPLGRRTAQQGFGRTRLRLTLFSTFTACGSQSSAFPARWRFTGLSRRAGCRTVARPALLVAWRCGGTEMQRQYRQSAATGGGTQAVFTRPELARSCEAASPPGRLRACAWPRLTLATEPPEAFRSFAEPL